ncbi:hypothetical protein KIS4809_3288 [Bacillus sp. ZZV12-4809]|nr:hypothetical protein KIS4809_3288 [Bacillus sp. ZZV12-4809]
MLRSPNHLLKVSEYIKILKGMQKNVNIVFNSSIGSLAHIWNSTG